MMMRKKSKYMAKGGAAKKTKYMSKGGKTAKNKLPVLKVQKMDAKIATRGIKKNKKKK